MRFITGYRSRYHGDEIHHRLSIKGPCNNCATILKHVSRAELLCNNVLCFHLDTFKYITNKLARSRCQVPCMFISLYNYSIYVTSRCNRLRCPLARMSGLQCFNMGHNGHGINLYGFSMTLMGNLHAGGQSSLGHLSLVHRSLFSSEVPIQITDGEENLICSKKYICHMWLVQIKCHMLFR